MATKKIKVLSHDITYTLEDPGMWRQGGMGMASSSELTVLINSTMPHDAICSTTLHEVIHIIDGLLQLDLSEQQTDGVALGIHSLLKENKKFMESLYG